MTRWVNLYLVWLSMQLTFSRFVIISNSLLVMSNLLWNLEGTKCEATPSGLIAALTGSRPKTRKAMRIPLLGWLRKTSHCKNNIKSSTSNISNFIEYADNFDRKMVDLFTFIAQPSPARFSQCQNCAKTFSTYRCIWFYNRTRQQTTTIERPQNPLSRM